MTDSLTDMAEVPGGVVIAGQRLNQGQPLLVAARLPL